MSPQRADSVSAKEPSAEMSDSDPAAAAGAGTAAGVGTTAGAAKAAVPEPTAVQSTVGFPLKVRAAWDETPTLRGLRLHGPVELLQQYRTPGQYLELVHTEAGSGYFALAAAPGPAESSSATVPHAELELLVRRGPGLAGVLAALQPAEETHALPPEPPHEPPPRLAGHQSARDVPRLLPLRTPGVRGAGFALTELEGRDLLLVAAGSGIAPLRAVLQFLRWQRPRFGQVALYYGERTESDIAYRRELEALRDAAVTVELVLSRPLAGWHGGIGYVQTHLRAAPPPWLGPSTVALLCGQSGMVSEVTALLIQHHVPASQILMNY